MEMGQVARSKGIGDVGGGQATAGQQRRRGGCQRASAHSTDGGWYVPASQLGGRAALGE